MHRVFSGKTPRFVSCLPRAQHAAHRGNALTSTRVSTSKGSLLGRATSSSARQMMKTTGESKKSMPALFLGSNVLSVEATAGSDPFNYSSGRWLRQDALERESRNVRFDFDALCRRVVALCPGANSVTSYGKKEGGFNRVFIFRTDNAKHVVARLPFPVAGPRRLITNSEVATIRFCKSQFKMIQQGWLSA